MNTHKIPTLYKTNTNISTEYGRVFSFPTHIHSYCEMLLYEPFDGYVCINDKIITPDKLTATIIIPGDFHEIVVNNNSNSKYIKISFITDIFEKMNYPQTSMVLKPIDRDSLFFRMYNEIAENPANEPLKKVLTEAILCIAMQKGEIIPSIQPIDNNRYSSEAIKIINKKYNEDLTLPSVAKLLSITPQHLSNTFKSNVGITFSGYLTAVRLQHAEKLLIDTNESVTDICDMCGYKNFSHFIRSFKKTYGMSPSSYRKSKQQLK